MFIKSKQLIKMSEDVGYYETLRRFKLPFSAANIFLKPKNGNNFSCEELTEIMFYYLFESKEIPQVTKIGKMKITNEPYEGSDFYWDTSIVDGSGIEESSFGYAQPFLCTSEDKKMIVALRFDFYTRGSWQEPDEDYIEEDEYQKEYVHNMNDIEFKTLDQAKSWYLNEYPKVVKKFAKDYFKNAKNYFKKSQ